MLARPSGKGADQDFEKFKVKKKPGKVEEKIEITVRDEAYTTTTVTTTTTNTTSTSSTTTSNVPTKTTSTPTTSTPPSTPSPSESDTAANWSVEEQKLLEKGLKSVPSTATDRWDQIATIVGKSKKDCMLRYKYLAAQIKQKQAAAKQ